MKVFRYLALLFCILIPLKTLSVESFNLQFSQLSTKDGLSQNTVRAILEDKKGFIWAGTLDGINKYDGYKIRAYKPELNNPNSLVDHRVKDIFQDRDGYLWIKTYKNEFNCYDPEKDLFVDYFPKNKNKSQGLYANYIELNNGDIWLWGNSDGCLRIRKTETGIVSTPFLNDVAAKDKFSCRFIFEDSKSVIWVGGNSGLFSINGNHLVKKANIGNYNYTDAIELNNKIYFTTTNSVVLEYDTRSNSFRKIYSEKVQESFLYIVKLTDNELLISTQSSGLITLNTNTHIFEKPQWAEDKQLTGNIEFLIDRNQGVWVFNHSGIMWYYNAASQKVKKIELIPSDIVNVIDLERYVVFIDSKNLIWITTYGNGIYCYDPQTDELSNYKYNPSRNSPASDYLLSITEDRHGDLWVGSEYAGIIKISKSNYKFRIIRPEEETSLGKNNNVRTIYRDAFNNIWLGTKNGSLYVYDNSLTTEKRIYNDINPYALMEDSKNRIWIGTKGRGIFLIDRVTFKEIAHLSANSLDNNALSHNSIFSILKDNKDRIWIGTFGGGINLAEESQNGITFKRFFYDKRNLSYIRYLYQDSKGQIWAGTNDGVIRFDPDELLQNPEVNKIYRMNLGDKNGLNCNDIKTIYEDENGEIWIGTAGGGLNKYVPPTDTKPEHFVAYTTKNGLSGDIISGILQDKENNLWISTENGITKFDKSNNSFMVYHFSEKTYGNHFNENANVYSHDGYMLWGSLDGLLVFNPESFVPDTKKYSVTLTNFFILNQNVTVGEKGSPLEKSISYSDKIELNYKQNTFTIEFASLDLKDPLKNKYIYLLENYDKQWSSVSHLNTATYKNLPAGNYIFKVRGTNSEGVWNSHITQLSIEIKPPFWRSWYAYIFYIILLAVFLFVVLKFINNFNKLNNNIKVEKELTNYKLRFFTNISHEFRTPLTLIRASIENLNNLSNIPEKAFNYIKVLNNNSVILTKLIDQLLEFRKIQNNVLTLDLEETDIIGFIKEIFISFQSISEQKNIQYVFSSETEHYQMYIDSRKLDKIMYNLLSNAFKFTPKNGRIELSVSFDPKNQSCLISVKDNGIGIPKEKQDILFKRFMQINFSYSGTGVGLSLVKEFVDVHKGKIWYESNQDKGSVFNLELSTNVNTYQGENFIAPNHFENILSKSSEISLYPTENVGEIQMPEIEDSVLSNYNILIIDDNSDIRNYLADELSKYFMVTTAEDGKTGLQKAIETNPDLIICDIMMPEMDGFEVTRRLKEDFQTCHILIILLTAYSSMEQQMEGIKSGAEAFIMKPFSLKYLVVRVFKLIEQRELLKKHFSNEYDLDGYLISSSDKDKVFFNFIDKILEEHIGDSQFTVDKFAELAKQRRTLFYKKVKGITGLSPNELIKVKRMKKAAGLLLDGNLTVAEVSYKVGFDDPFYFSKCFKVHFNYSPSKYGQNKQKENNK